MKNYMIDEFLKPNASLKHLIKEYQEYKQIIIAVDFDNTLYDFHKNGSTYNQMIELVKKLKSIGCFIVIWTANQDMKLIKSYLKEKKILYDLINDDPQESLDFWANKGKTPSRKIYANVYVDDRGGLQQTYKELEFLVWLVENNILTKSKNE
jgi:FMN phosphatase YigB (HAD superfamily)